MQSFSTKTDKKNTLRLSHYPYYRDRATEYELCRDFPTDEILIDGLYSMQTHFDNNGVQISIPIVRVMNAAHYIAAYMFSNDCAGDQLEYEALAAMSVGRDRQLAKVIMIVLAAMLLRTEGFRARQCRSVILENRDPDFEEGVTLYDRFLRSAERRFSMEDFLTDIPALIEQNQQLQIENNRLITEISQLKYTLSTMEEKYQQINIATQNVNYGTINNYYGFSQPSSSSAEAPHTAQQEKPAPKEYCIYICREKLQEQGIYTLDEFELMTGNASKGTATDFAAFLKRYQAQGILNFMGHSKRQIFDNLRAHYPEMRAYEYPNFAAYF